LVSCPGNPQTTPSPTASGGINISGSYPYTIFASPAVPQNTASPTATSTSTAGAPSCTYSGAFPYTQTCDFPVAGATQAPGFCNATQQCFIKSGTQTWLAYVETLASVTHIWPGNDTAPCNTVADAVGSGATALPSPVALATPTSGPGLTCGAPGISNDGNTSINFAGTTAVSYLTVPSAALPGASATWSVCAAVKTGQYSSLLTSTHAIIWAFEQASGSSLNYNYFSSGTQIYNIAGVNESALYETGNAAQYDCLTVNGSTKQDTFYVDGTITFQTTPATNQDPSLGFYFGNGSAISGQNWPMTGRMCCFLFANTVLTQAQIQAMTQALGY
jgi:hypothetical protein